MDFWGAICEEVVVLGNEAHISNNGAQRRAPYDATTDSLPTVGNTHARMAICFKSVWMAEELQTMAPVGSQGMDRVAALLGIRRGSRFVLLP